MMKLWKLLMFVFSVSISTSALGELIDPRTYRKVVDESNYEILEKHGLQINVFSGHVPNQYVHGNLQFSVYVKRGGSYPASELFFEYTPPQGMPTHVPIMRSCDTGEPFISPPSSSTSLPSGIRKDCNVRVPASYTFVVGIGELEHSWLDVRFNFPDGYKGERYYFSINLEKLARFQAVTNERLRQTLKSLNTK